MGDLPILPQGVFYDPVDLSNLECQRPSLGFRFKLQHRRPETPPPDPLDISEIDKPVDCTVVPAPTVTPPRSEQVLPDHASVESEGNEDHMSQGI